MSNPGYIFIAILVGFIVNIMIRTQQDELDVIDHIMLGSVSILCGTIWPIMIIIAIFGVSINLFAKYTESIVEYIKNRRIV
jgi:hypothetical protein